MEGAVSEARGCLRKGRGGGRQGRKGMPSSGEAERALGEIDAFVGGVATVLRPQPGSSEMRCQKNRRGREARAEAARSARRESCQIRRREVHGQDGEGRGRAVKLFGKLDGAAKDCQTTGDASSMVVACEALVVGQLCDDDDLCTNDAITGLVCPNDPIACPAQQACDFLTGVCAPSNCCLLSAGGSLCVVEIPPAQIPTSMSFCQGSDASHTNLDVDQFRVELCWMARSRRRRLLHEPARHAQMVGA